MLKRLFDIIVASLALLFFSPLLLAISILVYFTVSRKILFKQKRIGKENAAFVIVKFQTMKDIFDESGDLLPDDERITKFGHWLRSSSLDELPELWNVLVGDMALVGPRPLLPEYLPLYNDEQIKRHLVKPGITGWAQINGRNSITWEEKFDLDLEYIRKQSLWLDIRILLITIIKVVRREAITGSRGEIVGKFEG